MSPFPYLQIISLLQTDPIKYYLILCVIVIACAIPIYFAISKLSTLIGCNRSSSQHCQCSKCSLRRPKKANIVQNTNPKLKQNKNKSKSLSLLSPNRSIKRPKSYISPSKSKQKKVVDDADIESDIINELDQYHKTKGGMLDF